MGQAYQMRQEVLNKAYMPEVDCPETLAESLGVNPDFMDIGYVYLRTYVPSWVLMAFIILGFVTFILATPAKKIIKNIIRSWVKEADK